MDISERWKLTEKEITKAINMFNTLKIDNMSLAVETARAKMKEFMRYLANEPEQVKTVFKDPLNKYTAEI
jgi:hypothetical protein